MGVGESESGTGVLGAKISLDHWHMIHASVLTREVLRDRGRTILVASNTSTPVLISFHVHQDLRRPRHALVLQRRYLRMWPGSCTATLDR